MCTEPLLSSTLMNIRPSLLSAYQRGLLSHSPQLACDIILANSMVVSFLMHYSKETGMQWHGVACKIVAGVTISSFALWTIWQYIYNLLSSHVIYRWEKDAYWFDSFFETFTVFLLNLPAHPVMLLLVFTRQQRSRSCFDIGTFLVLSLTSSSAWSCCWI